MSTRDLIERVAGGESPRTALVEFTGNPPYMRGEVPHEVKQDARDVMESARHMSEALAKGDLKGAVLQFEAVISGLADVAEGMGWPHLIAQGLGQARSQVSMNPHKLAGEG